MGVKMDGFCEDCECVELTNPTHIEDGKFIKEVGCRNEYLCKRAYKKGEEKNDFSQEIKEISFSIKRNSVFMILEAACVLFLAISHLLGG